MKLLIISQVIDSEHPILGFFHRWIEEFAKHCEQVHVICLQAGKHSLPANVTVHSLGKESGKGRLTYLRRFYKLIWSLRHEYDSVFVHMNQEYVLLGGLLWKWWGKHVDMWRNHYAGSVFTRLAGQLCERVYYTSNASYTATFKNAVQMPIGIDEQLFHSRGEERTPGSLLYVGRISTSKRIKELLEALQIALSKRPELHLTIVGPTPSGEGELYEKELREFVTMHNLPVTFAGPTSWEQLPAVYSTHELCINLSPPGMFDKVIGEALACGCDIVTTNNDLRDTLYDRVLESPSGASLAGFLQQHQYQEHMVKEMADKVLAQHSLPSLIERVL